MRFVLVGFRALGYSGCLLLSRLNGAFGLQEFGVRQGCGI